MTTLPQRKPPRLPGYDYCTAGAYFITICAKNRRCIFGSILPTDKGIPIPQRIRIFKGRVAHEAGPGIFQRSFYDHVVRHETEYREICAYIQTNPARWAFDKFYIEGELR